MATSFNSRERVLKLLRREKVDTIPLFSGMGNVTIHGLEKYGWRFPEIHNDATKMAKMAASTFQLFGFESVVVPFDMGVEAEALGSEVNYYTHATDILYPTITGVCPISKAPHISPFRLSCGLASHGRQLPGRRRFQFKC